MSKRRVVDTATAPSKRRRKHHGTPRRVKPGEVDWLMRVAGATERFVEADEGDDDDEWDAALDDVKRVTKQRPEGVRSYKDFD